MIPGSAGILPAFFFVTIAAFDPVASITPRGLPAQGLRSAPGTDTIDPRRYRSGL